jgi:hypothetical protein
MPLHPLEDVTVRAFIKQEKQGRYLGLLANARRREKFLGCLNHCCDFDDRFAESLPSSTDLKTLLVARGASAECHLISDVKSLDGRSMAIGEAIDDVEFAGFGTILCCIAGRLACYIDVAGTERRLLLERSV